MRPQTTTSAQINAVLPSNTPVGPGTLTVGYNGATSPSVPITVVPASFGTFTWTGAGDGPGIFTKAVSYAFLTPFSPAKPTTSAATGDYITIWGTGLGPVPSAAAEQSAGPMPISLCPGTTCPTVYVVGQQATVTYAGRSGYTALDQSDFIVPENVQGCNLPVAIVTGPITSDGTNMSVDPNGAACSDADGLSTSYVNALLSSNGSAHIGVIGLTSQLWNIGFDLQGDYEQWLDDSVTAQIGTFGAYTFDTIQGLMEAPSPLDPATQVECVVPSSLGSFTAPPYMLATLPVSAGGPLAAGVVMVGPTSAPQKVSPPPNGLDALYMYYRILQGYTVSWE